MTRPAVAGAPPLSDASRRRIEQIVANAKPLTQEQRDRIAGLLAGPLARRAAAKPSAA